MTFTFNRWPWKTIRHLFYTTLSFVHHFKAIGEFKRELQSGNAQFGSKLVISCSMWPRNLIDDLEKKIGHLFYATLSFVHHFKAIGEFKLKCDLAIWLITLKNKRAHFLCHFKLCASFRSHWIYHLETPNLGQMDLGQVYRDFSLLMIVLDNCVKWNI